MSYLLRMKNIFYKTDSEELRTVAEFIASEADAEIAHLKSQLAEAQEKLKRLTDPDTKPSQKTWRFIKLNYKAESFCDICDCNPSITHQVEDPNGYILEICGKCADERMSVWAQWAGK